MVYARVEQNKKEMVYASVEKEMVHAGIEENKKLDGVCRVSEHAGSNVPDCDDIMLGTQQSSYLPLQGTSQCRTHAIKYVNLSSFTPNG